jgi:hypothetical protein
VVNIFPNAAVQALVTALVHQVTQSLPAKNTDLYKNKVDPFSALIDSMLQGIPLSRWLTQEKMRQTQKTLQNCIGSFHQSVIASFNGWDDLGTGNVVDIRNIKGKIIAEIKNKFNTTKGNHKIQIYRDLETELTKADYHGFCGYYVEIIPSGSGAKTIYNKPFVPSDNTKNGQRVVPREDIRLIDGRSFYQIVTGAENALAQLYEALPQMIRIALKSNQPNPEQDEAALFLQLFQKAFS